MKNIKDIPHFDRPREKLATLGAEALSDPELLVILLGSGVAGKNVFQIAHSILRKIDRNGRNLDVKSLVTIDGVGFAKACQILAAFEFARRRLFRDLVVVQNAKDVLPLISHIADKKQENFICISLNGANEVIGNRVVTVGLLNSTQIHPREVFADVISDRAAAVMLAHNHPSGILKPSADDIAMTKQMVEAGRILGISVLDHIIITKKGYLSFKKKGLID
jgi:DNA repair protein RadC